MVSLDKAGKHLQLALPVGKVRDGETVATLVPNAGDLNGNRSCLTAIGKTMRFRAHGPMVSGFCYENQL